MPITKLMKGLPSENLSAEGLMYHDICVTECQKECAMRLGMTIQLEQEAYMTKHPEISALLKSFLCKMIRAEKRRNILKEAGMFFTNHAEILDREIRKLLNVDETGPYIREDKLTFNFEDPEIENDLKKIIMKHYPPEPWVVSSPYQSTPNTPSSSFISIVTSDTTLPTPEPVHTPEPTISEVFYKLVSNAVDKAIYLHVDDRALRYDTAYVEISKCVEEAMEIPVVEIREDIAELYYNAYKLFEVNIDEKERIAAEIAWEKRMRKKLKRTLRRWQNFKGYETPPTPKSEISSHESYKKPPPKPCICHPQFHYNRYPKDRFGIYLPQNTSFIDGNTTVTPAISAENIAENANDEKPADTKSIKSVVSTKTTTSMKSSAK